MISLEVGDRWVWSLIIFMTLEVLFDPGLDPRPKCGGVGGPSPPLQLQEGLGGQQLVYEAPQMDFFGKITY